MTYPISDVTRRVVYSGSAGTGPYTFTFEVLTQGDIGVYKNSTLLTLTTDYTVTINVDGTGYITLVSAATAADTIAIFGNKGIQRSTDFVTGGDLFANSLNDELDAQTIFAQQNAEAIVRAIRAPQFDPTGLDMTLPAQADRADTILQFDTNGEPTVVTPAQFIAGLSGAIIGANYITNNATGDGTTVNFTLSSAPGSKGNLQIYIDGVYQNKNTFSLAGTTVTFTEAPPLNASVEFIIGYSIGSTSGDATGIDFTQQGTGAVTRTVANKLYESVSVKDFGAVGDGVTDDTAAIQLALASGAKHIIFPNAIYKIASTLTISRSTSDSVLIDGCGSTLSYSGSGVAVQIGDGLDGFEYSKLCNLTIASSTATTLMHITGEDVAFSVFENIRFDGVDLASGSVVHGLLIQGNRTYFNIFNECNFLKCDYGVSINYDHDSASWNAASNTSNASRFDNCSFNYLRIGGAYIGGSVGNSFNNLEFTNNNQVNYFYDVELKRNGATISKSNSFEGRFESHSVNGGIEIRIGDGCVNNYILMLVQVNISFETALDEHQQVIAFAGGNPNISAEGLLCDYIASSHSNGVFRFTSQSGQYLYYADVGLYPTATDHNKFSIGYSLTQAFKDGWFAGKVNIAGSDFLSGAGTPEGSVTAPVGSLYTRTDGGSGTTLYVKESGAGNTGWVAK